MEEYWFLTAEREICFDCDKQWSIVEWIEDMPVPGERQETGN